MCEKNKLVFTSLGQSRRYLSQTVCVCQSQAVCDGHRQSVSLTNTFLDYSCHGFYLFIHVLTQDLSLRFKLIRLDSLDIHFLNPCHLNGAYSFAWSHLLLHTQLAPTRFSQLTIYDVPLLLCKKKITNIKKYTSSYQYIIMWSCFQQVEKYNSNYDITWKFGYY